MAMIIIPKELIVFGNNDIRKFPMKYESKKDLEEFGKQLTTMGGITILYKEGEKLREQLILKENILGLGMEYEERKNNVERA